MSRLWIARTGSGLQSTWTLVYSNELRGGAFVDTAPTFRHMEPAQPTHGRGGSVFGTDITHAPLSVRGVR